MRFISLLPLLIVFLPFSNPLAAETVFLESDGRVVFDVESAAPAEGWTMKTELEGFHGTGYFEWTGPNYFSSAGNGTIKYTFRISQAGNYQMRWRNRIAAGDSTTDNNDSWIRLATGEDVADEQPLSGWTKAYINRLGSWNWETKTKDHVGDPIRQYLSEGDHTMEISGRSAGHAIDRIVLYHYDTIDFQNIAFNNFALSETAEGTGTTDGGDPSPDPQPDPNAKDWSITQSLESAGECTANTLALAPTADIYLQNTTAFNLLDLRVDGAERMSLIKFDLSLVPASKTGASLAFFTGGDDGNGTIGLYAGSHSNWTEVDSILADVPSASIELGSYTGAFDKSKRFALPFDASFLSTDSETLLLEMTADSNDISILSSETANGPRLLLVGGDNFCSEYAQLLQQSQTPPEPTPTDPPVDSETPTVDTETPPVSSKDTTSDDNASSSGYLATIGLLAILLWRRRRQS